MVSRMTCNTKLKFWTGLDNNTVSNSEFAREHTRMKQWIGISTALSRIGPLNQNNTGGLIGIEIKIPTNNRATVQLTYRGELTKGK